LKEIKELEDILYIGSIVGKANVLLENFQYDEAIELLKNIPEDLDKGLLSTVLTTRGDAYLHKGDYPHAITLLKDALKHIYPDIRSQALSLLGQSYFWNKQYDEAIDIVEEKIALLINSRSTSRKYLFVDHNLIGDAFLQMGEYQKAIKAFEKALSIKADYQEAQHNVTLAKFKQEQGKNPDFTLDSTTITNEVRWWDFFGTDVQAEGVHTGVIWKFDWGILCLHKALEYDPENDDIKRGLEVFTYNRGLCIKLM